METFQKIWWSIEELAKEIGIPKNTQAQLRSKKSIPFHKIGRLIKYKISDINDWIEKGKIC